MPVMEVTYYQDILCVIYDKKNYNGLYDIIHEQLFIYITTVHVFMSSHLIICLYTYVHCVITTRFILLLFSIINNLCLLQIIVCMNILYLNIILAIMLIKRLIDVINLQQ